MEKITENVYAGLKFRGCNSGFVVTAEGIVMVDTPMVPSEAKKWRQEVSKLGEIKYVINNEPHSDHVAGNCWMDGIIIASEGTREAIKQNRKETLEAQMGWMAPDALPLPLDFHFRLPDITFTGTLNLYLGKYTFYVLSVPGHTPSETCVYIPQERVVFVSDNVIMGMPIMINAVPQDWLKSLKLLQTLEINKIIPGHGPVFGKEQLQQTYDNLEYVVEKVKNAMDKGWNLKEIQEKLTFAERFPLPPGDPMKRMRHESLAGLYKALSS